MKRFYLIITFLATVGDLFGQNIGIGTPTPVARLHLKGSANSSQLIIDANSTQTNSNPLIKFRDSDDNDLLWVHSDDASNVFIGMNTGVSNNLATGGFSNSFIGSGVGYANTSGSYNTALGAVALFNNVDGNYNTATGYAALTNNISGGLNTASGYAALFYNSTGVNNTANGWAALYSNTTGIYNTASGVSALYSNTTGDFNTSIGMNALHGNTTASANTATGYAALYANTTGFENTATGYMSLTNNSSGSQNTAFGSQTLAANSIGEKNSATGFGALNRTTAGSYNVANGSQALYNNTTGSYNIAIGFTALFGNTTGSSNTAVGSSADISFNNLSNATAIGVQATVNASNKVVIGNTSVTVIGGFTGWSNLSDSRFKKNIQADVSGLDFIMQLKPVTYTLDIHKLNDLFGRKYEGEVKDLMERSIEEKEKIVYSGFEAQEVEKAALASHYNFSGLIKPQNEKDHYSIVYSDFIPSLVKAIQEQQKIIEEQNKKIEMLLEENQQVKTRLKYFFIN